MGKEFIVDSEYQGYVFVGWAAGMFQAENGEQRPYANMYVLSPVSTYSSDLYESSGFKAEKKKCFRADVWKGLEFGDHVKLFFDDKGRVQMVVKDE